MLRRMQEITRNLYRFIFLVRKQSEYRRTTPIDFSKVRSPAYKGSPSVEPSNMSLNTLLTEDSWKVQLTDVLHAEKIESLERFLETEWATHTVCPPKEMIFKAFNTTSFGSVRAVIIGQDPYHTLDVAMGLSFSVRAGKRLPPSLRNIFKEVDNDVGCQIPDNGDLTRWSEQGVLLLNAVLTVRKGVANSHAGKGWESITSAAISALSQKREGLVFLLWGRYAQRLEGLIDGSKHHVLKAAHPSPYSADSGFFGCKHFSKANELLAQKGGKPIDWSLDSMP